MNRGNVQTEIRAVMEELGCDEATAAFAVHLTNHNGKDYRAMTLPLPAAEARRRASLLIEQHGFTPDEAARHVAGDRTAIEAVIERRNASSHRADSHAAD